MQLLDYTFSTPEENLACDEALLNEAEQSGRPCEVLRFWESDRPLVVLGYSSHVEREVHQDACRAAGIGIFRRTSGGAAVHGRTRLLDVCPGAELPAAAATARFGRRPPVCDGPHMPGLGPAGARPRTSRHVRPGAGWPQDFGQQRAAAAASTCYITAHCCTSFHWQLLDTFLGMPPRQPDYRDGREHGAFVGNLAVEPDRLKAAIAAAWEAETRRIGPVGRGIGPAHHRKVLPARVELPPVAQPHREGEFLLY